MTFLSSFLLGLVQGIAEFLPISSSGHLAIAQNLLGMSDAGTVPEFFDVLLHLGTLPLFVVLPVKDAVQSLSNSMVFIGAALIVTGVLLFVSDRVKKGRKNERTATWLDVLIVGLGQAIATMPGISRSGMTITTGCFVGFERKFAVRFSFLLSIPAVLGANILSLADAAKAGINWAEVPVYLVGVVTAAVVGYLCIRLLRFIADRGKFGAFAYYCWAAGVLTLVLNVIK